MGDSMEGEEEGPGVTSVPDTDTVLEEPVMTVQGQDVLGGKVICDGLLCSILHAMSHSPNKEEFISVIERACDEKDILESRKKLFTLYNDVICDKQKKPILQITRGSVRKNIEDIVEKMIKIDKGETSGIFFMPWDYVIKPFETDTEYRAKLIEKEVCTEIDVKIDSLKDEMNLKNQALIELIHTKFSEVLQQVSAGGIKNPTFAGITAGYVGGQGGRGAQGVPQAAQPPAAAARGPWNGGAAGGVRVSGGNGAGGAFLFPAPPAIRETSDSRDRIDSENGRAQGQGGRSRSASKRRRGENGVLEDGVNQDTDRAGTQSQNKQKRFVVGTSNNAGRKMKSPPADIFVYGVHPDTSLEDIVQDLAFSDIVIQTKDISIKSKEEAFLKSYKISVKAEDLQRALDPSVWPLRVKVREFIHYSRRPAPAGGQGRAPQQGQDQEHQGQGRLGQQGEGRHGQQGEGRLGQHEQAQGQAQGQGQEHRGVRGAPAQFLSPNMYAVLDDNATDNGQKV